MTDLPTAVGNQLDGFDLSALSPNDRQGFTELVLHIVGGDLDLSFGNIVREVAYLFFAEVFQHGALIRQLLVLALLSAVLHCLTDNFKSKSVGALGFYVSYILIIATGISAFRLATGVLGGLVSRLTGMMEVAVPLMISLSAFSGNVAGAFAMHPLLLTGIWLISQFMTHVFIPLITAAAVLHIINHMVEGSVFGKLVNLMKTAGSLLMKGMIFLFLFLLGLQRIGAPIANNFALRTAHNLAGAVPVVGNALNAAMDTVLQVGTAARSGVLVALLLVLALSVSVPLLKLAAFVVVYRVVAALIQPLCDHRIVECLDGLGEYTGLLLRAGLLFSAMFMVASVMVLVV